LLILIVYTAVTHGPVLCEQESWGIHFEDGNGQDIWDISLKLPRETEIICSSCRPYSCALSQVLANIAL